MTTKHQQRRIYEHSVQISCAEYKTLLEAQRKLVAISQIVGLPANPGSGQVSPINRDPEVLDFIRSGLGKSNLTDLVRQCRERFGEERTPSKSAVHRFWQRLNGIKPTSKRRLKEVAEVAP